MIPLLCQEWPICKYWLYRLNMKEQQTPVPGIVKVGKRGILLNKDNAALEAYHKSKNREARSLQLEQEIQTLKNDMREIKTMLQGLIKTNGIS